MLKRWRLWALRCSLTSLEEEHPRANTDDEWDLTLAAEIILSPSFTISLQHHLDCAVILYAGTDAVHMQLNQVMWVYIAVLDLVLVSCVYRCCVSFFFCFFFVLYWPVCSSATNPCTLVLPLKMKRFLIIQFWVWIWSRPVQGRLQSSFKASGFKRENGARGFRETWTGSLDMWLHLQTSEFSHSSVSSWSHDRSSPVEEKTVIDSLLRDPKHQCTAK